MRRRAALDFVQHTEPLRGTTIITPFNPDVSRAILEAAFIGPGLGVVLGSFEGQLTIDFVKSENGVVIFKVPFTVDMVACWLGDFAKLRGQFAELGWLFDLLRDKLTE